MPYGAVYKTWHLSDDFNLTYIIGSDMGRPSKINVGDWFLSNDTLKFNFNPKSLKYNASYLPTARKYKTFTLKWSGRSKIVPTEGKWKETPLNIETNVIFLVDVEKLTLSNTSTEIVRYIESNFDKSLVTIDDKGEILEINVVLKKLIEAFCAKNELHFKVRTYFNGNLMKYL
jgi:hypothetical protein